MILILLVAAQFLRPELKVPPVSRDAPLPADVKAIFKKSCYDCHSNEAELCWGDQIVPGYWLVVRHIKQGRSHLNFFEWEKLTPTERKQKLWEAINHTLLCAMPRADYVFMHAPANVSDKELTVLKKLSGRHGR
ncbi:heme-binding domain-containing protein [Mucilaginibacter celer]|nr:heme-binding domain-containing protein [Mucilaginibacter celer]